MQFNGGRLRWELTRGNDESRCGEMGQIGWLWNHLEQNRLDECVVHIRISESMERFKEAQCDEHQSIQAGAIAAMQSEAALAVRNSLAAY